MVSPGASPAAAKPRRRRWHARIPLDGVEAEDPAMVTGGELVEADIKHTCVLQIEESKRVWLFIWGPAPAVPQLVCMV